MSDEESWITEEDVEVWTQAQDFASDMGDYIGDATGFGEAASIPIEFAAGAGAAIGVGIEKATDGAVSDGISDGLMGLVGEEHSYDAAMAFDDGEYVDGALHMAEGAGETISEWASDAGDAIGDAADEAWDSITDVFE